MSLFDREAMKKKLKARYQSYLDPYISASNTRKSTVRTFGEPLSTRRISASDFAEALSMYPSRISNRAREGASAVWGLDDAGRLAKAEQLARIMASQEEAERQDLRTGRQDELETALYETLMQSVADREEKAYTGFMPDKDVFRRNVQAQVNEIMGSMGVSQERFAADMASKGISSSSAATKALYGDVYAPVAKSIASTAAASELEFANLSQQGAFAAEQMRQKEKDRLVSALMGTTEQASSERMHEADITSRESLSQDQIEFQTMMQRENMSFEEAKYKYLAQKEAYLKMQGIYSNERIAQWRIQAELKIAKMQANAQKWSAIGGVAGTYVGAKWG